MQPLNAWQVDPNSWLGSPQSWQRWVAAPRSQQTAHIWGQTKVNLTKPQTCQPSERIRLPYSSHDICSVQEENNKTSYFLMRLKAFILHYCNVCSPSRSCFFFVMSPQGTFFARKKCKKVLIAKFPKYFSGSGKISLKIRQRESNEKNQFSSLLKPRKRLFKWLKVVLEAIFPTNWGCICSGHQKCPNREWGKVSFR